MEANGLRPEQVAQVRGFADRQLRHPDDPTHASNRRISVIVQYLGPQDSKSSPKSNRAHRGATENARDYAAGGKLVTRSFSAPALCSPCLPQ